MIFGRRFSKIIFAVLTVTLIGCRSWPDLVVLKSEILELHQATIDAHWNKDVDFFIRDISDDYFSVSDGEITHPTKEAIKTRFSGYLHSTTFTEYRDLREPIIGVSKDGSMAWSIVQVKVTGERTMDDGSIRNLDFICAWITLYERQDNQWIRLGEVSTFK